MRKHPGILCVFEGYLPQSVPQFVPQSDVDGRLFSLPFVCLLAECFLLMVIPPLSAQFRASPCRNVRIPS
jgi:hypothetical protein